MIDKNNSIKFNETLRFTKMLLDKPLTESVKPYHITALELCNSLLSFRLSDDQYQEINEIINR